MIILGADPGATAGIVAVQFAEARATGAQLQRVPSWMSARLLFAVAINKPRRDALTAAENDVEHCDRIAASFRGMVRADFVALEEPLDGAQFYNAQGQGERRQQRDTAFRLGVHYAALLYGLRRITPDGARFVSFPAKSQKRGRRGWMQARGNREGILATADMLLRSITTPSQYAELPRDKNGDVVEHIRMALGVVNHLVEYFLDYFPPNTNAR